MLDSQLVSLSKMQKPCISTLIRYNIFLFTEFLGLLQLNHNESPD